MSYITYDNVRAFLSAGDEQSLSTGNYKILYATSFSASNSTPLKRIKRIGQELDYYIQTGPKSASVSTSVIPVTGVGVNQLSDFMSLTGDFTSGSYIQVPSYRFDKCFLKSLSLNFEPWKILQADLQFDSYGLATGSGVYVFPEQTQQTGIISPLRGMSISVSCPNFTQSLNEYESVNFNVEVERLPNFEIGMEYPRKVSVAKITKTLQINGISNMNWMSDYQANNVVTTTISMPNGYSISVAGVLNGQNVSVDNNGVAKGGLQVIEEMV